MSVNNVNNTEHSIPYCSSRSYRTTYILSGSKRLEADDFKLQRDPCLGEVDCCFFLDFQQLTAEFGLAKERSDQSKKGVFLDFCVFLCGNELLGPKYVKKSIIRVRNLFSQNGSTIRHVYQKI
jgi:hypothetical protein